ncbi:hypothetical protein B0A54_12600 [Friedmanniomyces endolithicus]|uniref:Uncharacterized protein n=1 Tax=Friedmanniomyces endolithicus TaxID=329885 RepID=A0A4U0UKJ0_9PEZI|nr:hypothetical protein B0A54_12600 [Friedmanniomyces endolithicus]
MNNMALATSAAAISRAAHAARDASGELDELLVSAKFKDESLRRDVKQFLEDVNALQSRLAFPESSSVLGSEEQQALHAKLQNAIALCAGTFDQLALHARDAGKVKSGIFRQGRKLSAKDEAVIRAKQRIPVHAMTAKAYRDMIPGAEQHKFAFDHLKMDVYCEKEAVELADAERQSLSSELTIQDPILRKPTQRVADHAYGSPSAFADRHIPSSKENWPKPMPSPAEEASSVQTSFSIAPEDLHTYRPFSQVSDMASGSAFLPIPLSISHSQEPASIPQPSPGNDYLGFCKAAWQLQAGDRSVMKKTKQSSLSAPSTYWLCCTGPRCYFTTEIETSAIGTWESVERRYQKWSVAYRFAFLAKSHVRQNKVAAGQALYKCLFCVFLSVHAPIIQGTEAYIDHVAQKHRASTFSQVMLYRTGCVNDRICAAEESFDINLYPVASV